MCTNIDDCQPDPCLNGGTCRDGIANYVCSCVAGYTDKNCSVEIDECDPSPCKNGGGCTDVLNGFTCNCSYGYTGETCEERIPRCTLLQPCQNDGFCRDLTPTRYECFCHPGWTGRNCHISVNECASGPCRNGGTCTDGHLDYNCTCLAGYTGNDCEIDINECLPNPCENNASCIDGVGMFICQCASGYSGDRCGHVNLLSFRRNSFISVSTAITATSSLTLKFSFATTFQSGVLWYMVGVSTQHTLCAHTCIHR